MNAHRWNPPRERGDHPVECQRCGARRRTVPARPHESGGARNVYQARPGDPWDRVCLPCTPVRQSVLDVSAGDRTPLTRPSGVSSAPQQAPRASLKAAEPPPVRPSDLPGAPTAAPPPVLNLPPGAVVQPALFDAAPCVLLAGSVFQTRTCPYCHRHFFPQSADHRLRGRPRKVCGDPDCDRRRRRDYKRGVRRSADSGGDPDDAREPADT